MDPSRGNYFGTNNENAGVGNNLFGPYADVPNDQDRNAYNNYYNTANNAAMLFNGIERLSLQNPTNSINANQGVWDRPSTSQMHSDDAYPMGNTRFVTEEVNEAESNEEEDNEEESDEKEDKEESEEEEEDEEEESEEEESDEEDFANVVHQRDLYVIEQLMEEVSENRRNKKQRIPYLTSANNGFEWVMSALNSENPRKCPEVFGMKTEVFGMLCNDMVHKYGFHIGTKRAVSVIESLAMFLVLLRGQTLKQIQEQFQRGQATCSRQINKVLKCMLKLAADEIKLKRDYNDPHPYLEARPQYKYFKDCIGAMDGTHVFCKPKPKDAKKFWGCKYYLVDAGYPNAKGYMAPYKGHMYHLEDFRRGMRRHLGDNEYFNRWHSSLRSVIERAFGVWKNRWRMMKIPTNYPLALHKQYVMASMAIHNFIRRNCPDDEEFQDALCEDENYNNDDILDIDFPIRRNGGR
ncbi:hypothetical protein RHSIM_Rhsim12G0127400 [Rhododendron simsii]|uniref:DDE Tnp4 domain-containing protein n=1 Tax=Rhododendron simsii TaxID=118357 RepID=A0A834G459_RHOSS|nr:hypothetical protein RHSIM_Rhsim12G0127400 [Rhododendron simsii]